MRPFIAIAFLLLVAWPAACNSPPQGVTAGASRTAAATGSGLSPTATATSTAAATATVEATATATGTPTATPVPTATVRPSIALRQTVSVPHWLSFDVPVRWVRVAGSPHGSFGFASERLDLAAGDFPPGSADFFVALLPSDAQTPMDALQQSLQELPTSARDVSGPTRTTVDGLPAATASYRHTLASGDQALVQITIVREPDGRFTVIRARSRGDDGQFAAVLDHIEASLTMEEMHAAPAVAVPAPIPDTFVPYEAAGKGFKIAAPPDWMVEDGDFGLFVGTATGPTGAAYVMTGWIPPGPSPDSGMPQLLPFVAQDGVRISPITTASGDDHAVARAYYYGLVEEQPFYIVVGAVRRGAHQLFAMAFVQDPVQRPMPSLALQSIEDVVASLAVDPALLAPGGDSTADWSPDGTRIVFDSNRQGLFFLYTIPASGGEIRRLSPEAELTLPSIVE